MADACIQDLAAFSRPEWKSGEEGSALDANFVYATTCVFLDLDLAHDLDPLETFRDRDKALARRASHARPQSGRGLPHSMSWRTFLVPSKIAERRGVR